jgi:predicted aspartyl protease
METSRLMKRTGLLGRTEVQAKVIGNNETREYIFLVDTGATYLSLPLEEIEALGLQQTRGKIRLMSATGIVNVDTYFADGELMGQQFSAILVPASIPLIGYELLENLRFRVNPVMQEIEKVPDDEVHPHYLL